MKSLTFLIGLTAAIFLTGCETVPPPGADRGPHGTVPYNVVVEASLPGARIEVNGDYVGNTPLNLKVYGDSDGTFHDFGSYYFIVKALPLSTNQFSQVRAFQTGHMMTPEDRIPEHIFFDMNQQPGYPAPVAGGPPVYYGAPPPVYYGPPYPYYYGPSFRFYVGPRYYHHHW